MAENQNIEYKQIWKDEYLKIICAFVNAHGGSLYIEPKVEPRWTKIDQTEPKSAVFST